MIFRIMKTEDHNAINGFQNQTSLTKLNCWPFESLGATDVGRQNLAVEYRNTMPGMLRLLADHFRKICEPGAFYSLPSEFLDAMGWEEALSMLQSGRNPSTEQAETCRNLC